MIFLKTLVKKTLSLKILSKNIIKYTIKSEFESDFIKRF